MNDDRLDLLRATEELVGRPHRRARSGGASRGGEGDLAVAARQRPRRRERSSTEDSYQVLRDRWFDRLLGTDRMPLPSSSHAAYMRRLSPLEHVYTKDRATRDLPRDAQGARLRPCRRSQHPSGPRGPAAEEPARVRDRLRPAEGRPPDHAGTGRAPRLPGLPSRGGTRAPLRRLRPRSPLHVPPYLARPRADRDLLLPRRGDHPRARVARALLRALRRARPARTPRRPSS